MRNAYFNIGMYFDLPNNTSLTVVKLHRYTLNIILPDTQTRSILLAQRIVHQAYRIDFHTKSPHNTNIGLLVKICTDCPNSASTWPLPTQPTTPPTTNIHQYPPSDGPTAWVWPPSTSMASISAYSSTLKPFRGEILTPKRFGGWAPAGISVGKWSKSN